MVFSLDTSAIWEGWTPSSADKDPIENNEHVCIECLNKCINMCGDNSFLQNVCICLHDCLIPKNEFLIPYYKHRKCKKNKWINLFHDNSSTPSASPTLAFDEASQDSAQKVTCQIAWGCLEWVHHGKN